jgi:hypothetical protein
MYEKCNTTHGMIRLLFFDTESGRFRISGSPDSKRMKRALSEVQTLCGFAERTRVIDPKTNHNRK